MSDKKDPFETLTSETLRRAEEMCAGLGSGLSLERRGRALLHRGAITDLDNPSAGHVAVTVAEVEHDPGFTLIADQPLTSCRRALLVFRRPPSQDMRYLGYHKDSEPGKRGEADQGRHIVHFNIDQPVPVR